MKKIYLLPNVITAFGLSCGLFAIFKINMTAIGEADYHTLMVISGILILAAVADLLDGAIARAMKAESAFGGLFDSLADAITFGVGPSVIVLKTLSLIPGTEISFVSTTGAMVYSVCGVLRLVRFNVMNDRVKESSMEEIKDNGKNFTGLPIPAAAAAAISANLFLVSPEMKSIAAISDKTRAGILFFVMVILGYFMISRWKFPSLKTLHIRVASFQMVFVTVISTVLIFYGLIHHFAVIFLALSWLYIGIAWTLSIIRLITGKKSKALEDFDPEPEDHLD
jgi:CDP-diacylglycerol--serine O-phosphatidyltransferase